MTLPGLPCPQSHKSFLKLFFDRKEHVPSSLTQCPRGEGLVGKSTFMIKILARAREYPFKYTTNTQLIFPKYPFDVYDRL